MGLKMSKPIFSLIAPAVRSGFYKRVYDSACYKNKIPFEVIFVGNEKPKEKIDNTKTEYKDKLRRVNVYTLPIEKGSQTAIENGTKELEK